MTLQRDFDAAAAALDDLKQTLTMTQFVVVLEGMVATLAKLLPPRLPWYRRLWRATRNLFAAR